MLRAGLLELGGSMLGQLLSADPGQAIGPEPGTTNPEARAEWHNALTALAKFDGIDVRGLTDGQLMLRRDAYERETSWAPKYVAGELRLGPVP